MTRRAWLLVVLFVASLPAVTVRLYASDEIEYYAFLRSLWFDRDVSFDNEYRYFYEHDIARGPGFRETFLDLATPTGLRLNFGTMGAAMLWAPFYGVADLGVRLARAMGADVAADGYSRPYVAAVAYGSALYGFLAVLISAAVARRLLHVDATIPAAAVWLGTPLPFYMYLAPGMAHACSAFVVAVFVAAWLVVRRRWSVRGVALVGALAALMTMVREQDAFFALGPAVDVLWAQCSRWRRTAPAPPVPSVAAIAGGLGSFAVVFAPQAWAYVVLNGHLGPAQVVADKMRWYAPHAADVLISPAHGFFAWTPLAAVCVGGLLAVAARPSRVSAAAEGARPVLVGLVLMFLAQVYVSGSVQTWTVAGSFGQRRFLGTTVMLIVGLAALRALAAGPARRLLAVAAVVGIWWNLGLMVQFGANRMDRQRLHLSEDAYRTFVEVPAEMPRMVYRYFFDRTSFYQPVRPRS